MPAVPPCKEPAAMDTQPNKSQYDTNVWQPTIQSTDQDYSDEQKAVASYQQIYGSAPYTPPKDAGSGTTNDGTTTYQIPNLAMVYTEAPHLIPTQAPRSGASGGGSGDVVDYGFTTAVDLADVRSTEQTCLTETSNLIDAYNTLKSLVTAATASSTIFGQEVTNGNDAYGNPIVDKFDQEGKDFAASMNPLMEQLLQATGNAIESLGGFNAMLNTAGQLYAETDATALNAWKKPLLPIRNTSA
jgi:hypothetical protein